MHLRDIVNGAFYSVSFSCFYVGLVLFSSSERKIMRTPAHAHTHNTWMTDFRKIKNILTKPQVLVGVSFFFFFVFYCVFLHFFLSLF
jgi:hypothetical protein